MQRQLGDKELMIPAPFPCRGLSYQPVKMPGSSSAVLLTHFAQSSKVGTVTKGFDARLTNRPFLVFDLRAPWRSQP